MHGNSLRIGVGDRSIQLSDTVQDSEVSRFAGCLFGLACGGALGYPTEFMNLHEIRQEYGPAGIQDLPEPALYLDETQMRLAVARAYIVLERVDGRNLQDRLAQGSLKDPFEDREILCLYEQALIKATP